jgi:hypothetical protein
VALTDICKITAAALQKPFYIARVREESGVREERYNIYPFFRRGIRIQRPGAIILTSIWEFGGTMTLVVVISRC